MPHEGGEAPVADPPPAVKPKAPASENKPSGFKKSIPTQKAMKEAEQGWQKALDKIGERAGLTKGSDGTRGDPSIPRQLDLSGSSKSA